MQPPAYVEFINLAHYYGKRPCQPCMLSSRLCTSLIPRPMIVVFGLGRRLHVRMHTKLENSVFCNRQQPQFCEWLLLTRVEFEAVKTLSGCRTRICSVIGISFVLK